MSLKVKVLEAALWRELWEKHQEVLEKYKDMPEVKDDLKLVQDTANNLFTIVKNLERSVRLRELEVKVDELEQRSKDMGDEDLEEYSKMLNDIHTEFVGLKIEQQVACLILGKKIS